MHVQHVVIEAVLFVPQRFPSLAEVVHRVGDVYEVLPEFARDVLVRCGLRLASSSAIASMLRQYIAIQLVPSDCSKLPAGRQRRAAVKHADVVEPEESALENVVAFGVLAIDPPGEIQQQFVEYAFEKFVSPLPVRFFSIL